MIPLAQQLQMILRALAMQNLQAPAQQQAPVSGYIEGNLRPPSADVAPLSHFSPAPAGGYSDPGRNASSPVNNVFSNSTGTSQMPSHPTPSLSSSQAFDPAGAVMASASGMSKYKQRTKGY